MPCGARPPLPGRPSPPDLRGPGPGSGRGRLPGRVPGPVRARTAAHARAPARAPAPSVVPPCRQLLLPAPPPPVGNSSSRASAPWRRASAPVPCARVRSCRRGSGRTIAPRPGSIATASRAVSPVGNSSSESCCLRGRTVAPVPGPWTRSCRPDGSGAAASPPPRARCPGLAPGWGSGIRPRGQVVRRQLRQEVLVRAGGGGPRVDACRGEELPTSGREVVRAGEPSGGRRRRAASSARLAPAQRRQPGSQFSAASRAASSARPAQPASAQRGRRQRGSRLSARCSGRVQPKRTASILMTTVSDTPTMPADTTSTPREVRTTSTAVPTPAATA